MKNWFGHFEHFLFGSIQFTGLIWFFGFSLILHTMSTISCNHVVQLIHSIHSPSSLLKIRRDNHALKLIGQIFHIYLYFLFSCSLPTNQMTGYPSFYQCTHSHHIATTYANKLYSRRPPKSLGCLNTSPFIFQSLLH